MRTEAETTDQQDRNLLPGPSSSIQEFCERHHISKTLFQRLQAQGRGPRMMKLGRALRISADAERQWLADREAPSDTEARLIKREEQIRSRASRENSKQSFVKGNHISQRRKAATAAKAKGRV